MYLIDTNVISEARKRDRAHPGVTAFLRDCKSHETALYLASVSIGELRRGVELIRHRNDLPQAARLEAWLDELVEAFSHQILPLDAETAQVWGKLRVPHADGAIDEQIAAIALIHGLTVVTRNTRDFVGTGVAVLNPFDGPGLAGGAA